MSQELHAVIMPDGSFRLEWEATDGKIGKSQELLQQDIERRFSNPAGALLFLGFCDRAVPLSPSLDYWRSFCGGFAKKLSQTPDLETLRHRARVEISTREIDLALASAPLMTGAEYLSHELLDGLWRQLHTEFCREIRQFDGTVETFIQRYSPEVHLVGRVFFHLVENRLGDQPFAFLATYTTGLSNRGKSQHLPLKQALEEYANRGGKLLDLLATVHRAAKESALIPGLMDSGELFHPLGWSAQEAHAFLLEIPLYERAGILCRIPDWWKAGSAGVGVRIAMGAKTPSTLGLDALLQFDVGLHLGDTPLSVQEARKLLDSAQGLALIKNRWVAVDREKLQQALDVYDEAQELVQRGGLTFREALRLQLNPGALLANAGAETAVSVTNGQWLESVMQRMRQPASGKPVELGPTFKARLRPYQRHGLTWLSLLHSLNFGMCLADDMGLGKTVQVLALLHSLKAQGVNGASLLVVPASLIANWVAEIDKFAPDIAFHIAHPSAGKSGNVAAKSTRELDALDLVITTYTLAQKHDWLRGYTWKLVILDEAQAIKNPGARQTRAVKQFRAANRIAMTGTPVENRLADLWSLFDFINPGLLGSHQEFSRFARNLNKSPDGYARLRKLIGPFILRRLKTDKSVISDLPAKVEIKAWSLLSKKQAVLYRKLVEDLRQAVEGAEGIRRKGIVLGMLTRFKQVCNHPDHYTGSHAFEECESGKFAVLRDICEVIRDKRERVLVFTQFREMTGPLGAFLSEVFQREGLVLHGGTAVAKRKEVVARFQDGDYVPFLVLSLKAGGVGLNLTAANHVIHFDRWWNPAVENQATDRAFRIGQKKKVMVHKFVTKGTVEEKIDQMIESKTALSNEIIQSSGENWITGLNNEKLHDLFRLTP